MQASVWLHCSFCYPNSYIKVHKSLYFVTSLLLARNFLLSLFSFQGADPLTFFKVRLKHSIPQMLQSDLVGGDKRDRTADPLLAKQVLSQLSYTPTEIEGRAFKIKQRQIRKIFPERFCENLRPCS